MGETYKHKWLLEAEDRTKAAFATATQNARGLDKQIATLLRSAGPGGVLGAIGMGTAAGLINRTISETADEFDELAKRARAVGMTTEELDALEYAAEKARMPSEQLGVAMKTLMRQMTDAARGAGEGRIAFAALGISVTDGNGRLKSATRIMAEVAEKAGNLATAEERAAMMQKLFGESGVGMLGMLGNGVEGFRAMVAEGYALGTRYEDLVLKGEEYHESQLRLNRALRSMKDAIAAEALPWLSKLADTMSDEVMRATTGLEEEFRTFVGMMRTLPAEDALSQMEAKERELQAAVAATNAELESRTKAIQISSVGDFGRVLFGGGAVRNETNAVLKVGADAARAATELATLRAEMQRLRDQMKQADAAGKSNVNTTIDLVAAQKEAATIIESLRTPQERLIDGTAKLNQLVSLGYLTSTQYSRALEQMRAKVLGTAEAEREAATVIESLRSPQEKLAAGTAKLHQLMESGYLTTVQYSRAVENLRREITGVADAEREAASVIDALLTPQEQLAARTAKLRKLMEEGHITATQFARSVEHLRYEFLGTADAEREAAEVIQSLRSPQEEFAARLARLHQLMRDGLITHEQYAAAFAKLRGEYVDGSSTMQIAGMEAARAIGDGFSQMIRGQMSTVQDFEKFVVDAFGRIADAVFQAMVVDKLVASITGKSAGVAAAPSGAGLSGVPDVAGTANKSAGAVPVQINIQAVDTAGAMRVLQQNEPLIVGMVQKAYHRAGKRGPNG